MRGFSLGRVTRCLAAQVIRPCCSAYLPTPFLPVGVLPALVRTEHLTGLSDLRGIYGCCVRLYRPVPFCCHCLLAPLPEGWGIRLSITVSVHKYTLLVIKRQQLSGDKIHYIIIFLWCIYYIHSMFLVMKYVMGDLYDW
jgi:hypothetical protein